MISAGEFELRSKQWTERFCPLTLNLIATPSICEICARITFCSQYFGDAECRNCRHHIYRRAFRASDRRHHAGKILFRRSALRAGRAPDARADDVPATAQSDASAAGKRADRAVDPRLRG